ncbi:hypothetical protein CCICO_03910 [Corynebacterium ciconiae DSM 44920]|uniref:Rv0361 family membrane protein n=1 Tax=Corynebacterium ciconiae TaxID=227319 RepID=UPI00035F3E40|nr:hypothetical protein [Corynebacterium ciconiae]WKD60819.1 hypothetical protein CCICO_03910 [Corynebacterium ciconiae DSM 44920]
MSIASLSTKSVVAALLVLPLTLSACSRDEGDSAQSSSSSSTSPSTTTTTSTSTADTKESEENKDDKDADKAAENTREESEREQAPRTEQEQLDAAQQAAQQAAPAANQEPIEGGHPASAQDKEEIERLVRGWGEQTTLRSFMEYANNNTCRRVIESNGGYAASDPSKVPDVSLENQSNLNLGVESVSDIQVNGDSASARVTPTGPNPETSTMRFLREDGRWTMCN